MGGKKTGHGGRRTAEIRAFLENSILSGALSPGTRLDETELASRFSVSRTPVREALLQLASVGLLETGRRRGAIVARMSVEQVVAMLEVLCELEAMAARLAAHRMSAAEHEVLRAVHRASAACIASDDVGCFDEANKRLHDLIYIGSRNDFLADQVRAIRRRLWVYRGFPFQRPGRMQTSFADHEGIIAAIVGRDGDLAGRRMMDHISVGGRDFADLVANLARQGQPPV